MASLRLIVRSRLSLRRTTGNTLVTSWGPSMGDTPEAVPARLRGGEPIDVVIMVGYALGDLVRQGKVDGDSRVDLARSGIGLVVRAGAPRPDISSVDALKRTLFRRSRSPIRTVRAAFIFLPRCSSAWASPTRWRARPG